MQNCRIVEDLLPLYEEQLVQEETEQWIHAHLAQCESCRAKVNTVLPQLESEPIKSAEKMIVSTQRKLMLYQLLFVLLSFIFAMTTTIFSEKGFIFILSYFVLGAVTYAFYQRFVLTFVLAFVPIFIWTLYDHIASYSATGQPISLDMFYGAFLLAGLHTLFAVLGIAFGVLLQKAFRKDG